MGDLGEDELVRLYGPWAALTPRDVAALLTGYPGPWWVAGGWAVEAFTGVARHHADIDVGVLRSDLPHLRRHLAGRHDVWAATDGALRPLLPHDAPDSPADDVLPAGCRQVWLRRGATAPWEVDVLLDPGSRHEWVHAHDATVRAPMADALWERDGVTYLRPELQLLHKARQPRPKDETDLAATLPLLDTPRRTWLRDTLRRTLPGHPWLDVV